MTQAAAGAVAPCTDEIYAPKTASQLGQWINSLGRGDVGCLHAGTYGSSGGSISVNPSVTRTSEADRSRVRGYPGEALPKIVGGIYFSQNADYITLRKVQLDGSSFGARTIGVGQGADHVSLADLDVTNQKRGGVHGCIVSEGSSLTITRSSIHDCGGPGTAMGQCIYLVDGAATAVRYNVVYGCGAYAVYMYTDPDGAVVDHNVLDSSGGGVMFGGGANSGSCQATDSAIVENNAITNSSPGPGARAHWGCGSHGSGNVLRNNCFWNNGVGNPDLGAGGVSAAGNINANPLYQPGHHIPPGSNCYALTGDPAAGPPASSNTYFPTLPSGASGLPRDDSYCRSNVGPAREPRPDNGAANSRVPSGPVPWANDPDSTYWTKWIAKRNRVTGNYTGTTVQILRWGACKWGVDENIMRAVAVQESDWHQSTLGDVCGPAGRASYGLMQVKNAYCDGRIAFGGYPDTLNETALNVDFYGAYIRSCLDGDFYDGNSWLYKGRTIQQVIASDGFSNAVWGCVGSWFSGNWYDSGAVDYIGLVKQWLAEKPWIDF